MDDDAARSIFATELQDLLGVYEEQQQIAGEEEVYRDEIETAEHSDINLRRYISPTFKHSSGGARKSC